LFREGAFSLRKRAVHVEDGALTIENDAFAIVGVTFGFEKATSCLRTVTLERKKCRPRNSVTRSQSQA